MSTSLSNAHVRFEMPPSILPGCFLNVGWKSSFLTIVSCNSPTKSGPAPSGGLKSCRPATCIGCSRDSPMRNIESVGEMSSIDVTVPFPLEVTMTNTVGRVAGKVAFITGAARGQGREHAVRLAEEGADIIAVDVCTDIDTVGYPGATEADLDETAALVEKLDRRILTAKADVRDLDGLRAALQRGIDELGRPDIVVANAGISGTPCTVAQIDESAWQTMLDINLTGVMHTTKVALPHMSDGRGGSIILVSSMLGLRGGGYMAAYASAKHALVGLKNSLANELAPQWIRVNSIRPGNILTPMIDNDQFRRTLRPDLDEPTMDD